MCGIAGLVNAERNLFANNNYCKFVEQAAITGVLRLSLIHISEPTRPY